jgi:uncharacterized protein YjbI with pentapeptide repeats
MQIRNLNGKLLHEVRDATLRDADLSSANISEANLRGALLDDTNLYLAGLTDAVF